MDILTSAEAAELLGLSVRSIRHYVKEGRLFPARRLGRAFLFTREEVERFKALPRKGGRKRKPKD